MRNTKEIRKGLRDKARQIIQQLRIKPEPSLIYKLAGLRTEHSKLIEIRRKNVLAVQRWRAANAEHYKEYQRQYFQKVEKPRRASVRDNHPVSN